MRQYFTVSKSTCPLLPPAHSLQRLVICNIVRGIKKSCKCNAFFLLLPTQKSLKISGLFSRRVFAHSLTPIFNMTKHRHCRKDSDVDNTKGKDKFVTMQGMGACGKGRVAPITNLLRHNMEVSDQLQGRAVLFPRRNALIRTEDCRNKERSGNFI